MTTNYIGRPSSRVDGPAKVTGEAKYAAEHNVANLAHGFVVSGRVARGRITSIDASKALELPGVLRVFTHENGPVLAANEESYRDDVAPPGSPFRPLHDNQIKYSGQPVALVVAAYAVGAALPDHCPPPGTTRPEAVAPEPPTRRRHRGRQAKHPGHLG